MEYEEFKKRILESGGYEEFLEWFSGVPREEKWPLLWRLLREDGEAKEKVLRWSHEIAEIDWEKTSVLEKVVYSLLAPPVLAAVAAVGAVVRGAEKIYNLIKKRL